MSAEEALRLAHRYIAEMQLDMGYEESSGACEIRSMDFSGWLEQHGVENSRLFLWGLSEEPVGIHQVYKGLKSCHLYHCVVRIGDHIIDLSGAQFGLRFDRILWSMEEIKQLWHSVTDSKVHTTRPWPPPPARRAAEREETVDGRTKAASEAPL